MEQPWETNADWIWLPDYDDTRNPGKFALFRREFVLPDHEKSVTVHVSADSRYRLFLNGHSLSVGPCKGTPLHWNYETVDATPWLRKGVNVLATRVLRYSPKHFGNTNIMRTAHPGFILLASGQNFSVATDEQWRCLEDKSISLIGDSPLDEWLCVYQSADGPSRQFGWKMPGLDDSSWTQAKPMRNPFPEKQISIMPWCLFEREIPPLPEIPTRFKQVLKVNKLADSASTTEVTEAWNGLLQSRQPVTIPAHTEIEIDIAASEYSSGYLQFSFSGGAGAKVQHLSAESYELAERKPGVWEFNKGDRMDFKNGYLNGQWDSYVVAGRESEDYEPFWFRVFRLVRVNVKAQGQPLVITDFSYRENTYPLEIKSKFKSPTSPLFTSFWDISIRTLKNCMHETYEDCPFWEQSQFPFDTRTHMLLTYPISDDDRLIRKGLHDFHSSLRPDGLIAMHYPADSNVVLPAFSLFFPLMVNDHIFYKGDVALTKKYFPTVDAILGHYDRNITADGLVGQFSRRCWSFVDWVGAWTFGTPPAARVGPGTYFSLAYAVALQSAASIAEYIGRPAVAGEYLERKAAVLAAVNKHCFDGVWYYDGPISNMSSPPVEWRSQHCQVYAILAEAIKGAEAKALMHRTLEEKTLPRVSLAQAFYLFRALEKADAYHLAGTLWGPWKKMIAQNLDTWPEEEDSPRSECHAWSAGPLYELVAVVIGVKPGSRGYGTINISPRPELLREVDASVTTPSGAVRVHWAPDSQAAGDTTERARLIIEGTASTTINLTLRQPQGTETVIFEGRYEGNMDYQKQAPGE
ncbi:hypothetical protein ACHAPT_012186 [Fusarium lateritium]